MNEREVAAALGALDRRGFLRLAGAVAALGLTPSGCGSVPRELAPPEGLELRALSPRGYATFRAAAMRLVGPRGAEAIADGRLDPAAAADTWVARLPGLRAALGQGLWVLEFGVYPVVAKWRPFTSLTGPEQDAALQNLTQSRWDLKRDLFKGMKSLAMLTFYAQPASRVLTGYPGPFDRDGIAGAMSDLPGPG
jgi:hypothetical protein